MGDMLRADLEALRIMAADLRGQADVIAGIDPIDLIAKVGRAMPNSAIATAAATADTPLSDAWRTLSTRLHTLADTTDHGVTTYEATDQALETQLDNYLHDLP
ncbi:hypothetical protein [Nocardia sp. NPDC020380]|uniref:hypothetical protein n=1 Tax=Nocardia sp. NPDC020380 TaxID=3364309 RepID=UPI0037AFB351